MIVLVTVAVSTVLAFALIGSQTTLAQASNNGVKAMQADALAESGLQLAAYYLQNPSEEVLNGTVQYFAEHTPTTLHPCHCTDLRSKIAISKVAELQEVGSGLRLEYA